MAVQLAVAVRDARLEAIETNLGTNPILKVFGGTKPADCTIADAGTALATINLTSPIWNAASGGQKTKTGSWQDASADTSGTATHFRLYTSGLVCKLQGTITSTVTGTGDMLLDSTTVTATNPIVVGTFTLMDNNG